MAPDDSLSSVMRDEVQKVFPLKLEEANFAKLLVEPKPTSWATEAVFFNTFYTALPLLTSSFIPALHRLCALQLFILRQGFLIHFSFQLFPD